ncbi:MAG: M20 family metallopeptidase [Aminobacterium sp.]|uniref:M20 family metallopeptidase n=1 Tax=Aminobacterium sp. MB27-C1 TaxID=3070661 RepID=UPI001BCC1119|nr:M20 family metallopeptidase [Aminobacterium sp. MB27-C1]MDD2206005.1 M20 family metallopeptidase [Aminobacterium sp.]MDD3425874.1 M20 family metallopeptidase [Aminobacterium sp.]MDD3707182.1 M20 family metallopeptidase [Aminobacterium sp.]MDD4227838.1 M20 family metallopeptidase [Aminobacterium sp.]MDD4550722.1 M20 family metallopeptidase [Aminobacterium sp.]
MKNYTDYLNLIDTTIDKYIDSIWELNLYMASHPELGEQEVEASKRMHDFLQGSGYKTTLPYCDIPTSFCAEKGDTGPSVALLAEYDALPEIGHACGHCLHGSMSLLAGLALSPVLDHVPGKVFVIGTPAEETNGAKVTLAKEGVFDSIDLAMMIHCNDVTSYVDYRSLAMDAIEFTFDGQTAHAAGAPWEGRNALNGVQLFFHAIDMLRQHVKPSVRMHGIVSHGGDAPNIVPDKASAKFYFRAPERKYLNVVLEKIFNCAKGAALATETTVHWRNVEFSFDEMRPNKAAEKMLGEIFTECGVATINSPGPGGSSDMGNVSQHCAALQPLLAITDVSTPHHTRSFAKAVTTPQAKQALKTGAEILAKGTLRFILNTTLQEEIKKEFNSYR